MRAFLLCLFLVGPLFAATAVEAQQRKPQSFVAPRQMSEEELAASKTRYQVEEYNKHKEAKDPFPWRPLVLLGIVVLFTLPFGIKVYQNTAKDLNASKAVGGNHAGE